MSDATNRSHICTSPPSEEAPSAPAEESGVADEPQEEILSPSPAPKKGKRKSKLAAQRAVFEPDY